MQYIDEWLLKLNNDEHVQYLDGWSIKQVLSATWVLYAMSKQK